MEYVVYILYSKTNDKIYFGYSGNLIQRIYWHNNENKGYTKHYRPWAVVHVVFLDIHLPGVSGMELEKQLPTGLQVIFTTAFSDFALERYEYNAVDYLLKPFSFDRFGEAIKKLKFDAKQNDQDAIFLKVNLLDIHYLTSELDYTEFHLADKRLVVSNH